MTKSILIVDDEPGTHELITSALAENGYLLLHASDGEGGLATLSGTEIDLLLTSLSLPGMSGLEVLRRARALRPGLRVIVLSNHESSEVVVDALRHQVCDLLPKPFSATELRVAVSTAVTAEHANFPIEVCSANPEWLELSIPCHLGTVPLLYRIFTQLQPQFSPETREALGVAFRELLQNAIEHGGKCDPTKHVRVSYVCLRQMILCRIADPGGGFKTGELCHAAISNPTDDPYRHLAVRDQHGLRPGGFGILLVHQLVDEIVYSDHHNEVVFVKYL